MPIYHANVGTAEAVQTVAPVDPDKADLVDPLGRREARHPASHPGDRPDRRLRRGGDLPAVAAGPAPLPLGPQPLRRSRCRAGSARSAGWGRGPGRRRARCRSTISKPSSSAGAVDARCGPSASRTRAAGVSVRWRRLSLSGSSRAVLASMWSSQRRSPTVSPSSSGRLTPDRDGAPGQLGQDRFQEPVDVRDVVHRGRAVVLILVDDLARGLRGTTSITGWSIGAWTITSG